MIVDTSGLLAAFDPDERTHQACAAALAGSITQPVVSPFVIAELDYLITRKRGVSDELTALRHLAGGAYQIAEFGEVDLEQAAAVIENYRDLRIGVADASIVVLADRHDTTDILTLDERHFRAMTSLAGQPFRLHPLD